MEASFFDAKLDMLSEDVRVSLLRRAAELTTGDRNHAHGHPYPNMKLVAALWSAYLGVPVKPADCGYMMNLFKIARDKGCIDTGRIHLDNSLDGACYDAIAGEAHVLYLIENATSMEEVLKIVEAIKDQLCLHSPPPTSPNLSVAASTTNTGVDYSTTPMESSSYASTDVAGS